MPIAFASSDFGGGPAHDQLEIVVIGPGFGEAVLVHVGEGRWLAIDSCSESGSDEPASLSYLQSIGVDPAQVLAIVVSHWDDDHCRGLARLAAACGRAKIIISQAFIEKDFMAFVVAHDAPLTKHVRAGVREIRRLHKLLDTDGRAVTAAYPNRCLFNSADIGGGLAASIAIHSLSPSDEEYRNFLFWAASKMPAGNETRRVAFRRIRNDLSVVIHISVGDDVMLFGADLEEEGNALTGWSAILASTGRPAGKAGVFKVSHHGSDNGHHADVPIDLLRAEPTAIVAPFKNGSVSLPTPADVRRIEGYASRAVATSSLTGRAAQRRDSAVEKTIKQVTHRFSALKNEPGMVRLRKTIGSNLDWEIEHFGTSCPLAEIFN